MHLSDELSVNDMEICCNRVQRTICEGFVIGGRHRSALIIRISLVVLVPESRINGYSCLTLSNPLVFKALQLDFHGVCDFFK